MNMHGHRSLLALLSCLMIAGATPSVMAQEPAPQEQTAPPAQGEANGQPPAEEAAKPEEYIEIEGLPDGAGRAECVWFGRRAVNLLWRDDIDTAKRHLSLYDRFDCPGVHVQQAFSCIVRQGPIDPKQPDTLNAKVSACWRDPNLLPPPPPAAPAPETKPEGQ